MTYRNSIRVLACCACLAAVSGSAFCGEEPAHNPAPAPQSKQPTAAVRFLSAAIAEPVHEATFSLAADTYGNVLGVEVADVDAALRTQLGIAEGMGVVVTKVNKESEAAKAGLQQYDLVLKAGEQAIANAKQFHELVASQQGKPVTFHLLRKGKPGSVTIAVPNTPVYSWDVNDVVRFTADFPYPLVALEGTVELAGQAEQRYRIGVTLSEADDTLRSQLRLAAGEGLVVTEVVDDSPAAKAGIQKNDVLIKLDGKRLTTVDAINTQIQEIKDRKVTAALFRGGSEISVEIAPRLIKEPSYRHLVLNRLGEIIGLRDAEVAHRLALNAIVEARVESAARPAVAEQLAAVKKQLAELQRSVDTLEAALQAAPAEKPAPPEEK
ncbi:MAG: PDZ domain-containing protein [Deltaproteobacteria bacterium]